MIPGASAKPDGTFEMWRLDPGRCRISGGWAAPSGQYVSTASAVAAGAADGAEFAGSAAAEAAPDDYAARNRNRLQPERTGAGAGRRNFLIPKLAAGRYRVVPSWNTVYVKSTRVGSTVADGAVIDVSNGAGGELSLMLGAANATVAGTVQDEQEKPVGSIVILALTTDDFSLTPRTAAIKADGTYTFNNVAPGSYRIVAVQRNDMVPVQRPGGLIDYEDLMEPLEIHSGEKITKELKRRVPGQ